MKKQITVFSIAFHRNGISGEGFHAILFKYDHMSMFATVFEAPGHVAVLEMGGLESGDIQAGSNSWRGDFFEDELRAAIAKFEADRSKGR